MRREKTAVIVFPPFSTPTSPPLGAAMLKGYVERELPGWRVKVFDLNLWLFDRLLGALANGQFRLDPTAFPDGYQAVVDLLAAANTFRGKNDQAFFDSGALYNRYGEIFLRFCETYTRALNDECGKCCRGGPRTQLIREFLEAILAEKPRRRRFLDDLFQPNPGRSPAWQAASERTRFAGHLRRQLFRR